MLFQKKTLLRSVMGTFVLLLFAISFSGCEKKMNSTDIYEQLKKEKCDECSK